MMSGPELSKFRKDNCTKALKVEIEYDVVKYDECLLFLGAGNNDKNEA